MLPKDPNEIFTKEVLDDILPPQLSDDFFEAMYGDAAEGAYNIRLAFSDYEPEQKKLTFELQLHERPDKCLACNLTYGLPSVFSRHPVLNIQGMVEKIDAHLGEEVSCTGWELGRTQTPASDMHSIPLIIQLD
ncbi:MAG: pancreas/duodenum homeobox protein 1 [Deltaproteobacteria bacterium]|nr:pancreas/duodenum homeobox protein 1 [Deltaproteobacteria bacterium]